MLKIEVIRINCLGENNQNLTSEVIRGKIKINLQKCFRSNLHLKKTLFLEKLGLPSRQLLRVINLKKLHYLTVTEYPLFLIKLAL